MDHFNISDSLIDKIVCEVKSQGAFDQFRRECIADVDTKPAYQNLRQRVESSVSTFLKDQNWMADMNKNQLRDRLRRNITESGFLETGVERIVDQVVNPKINTVFLTTIEDISYKFLGIEKPKLVEQPPPLPPPLPTPTHSLPNEFGVATNGLHYGPPQNNILPNDLEAVSPESNANKSMNSSIQSDDADIANNSIGSGGNTDTLNDTADKTMCDDFESPAFEPLEGRASSAMSLVPDDDEDGDNSKQSAISGLTSQDSVESCIDHSIPEQPTYSIDDLSRIPPPPPPLPPPPPPPEDIPAAPKSEPMDTSDEQLHHDQNSALSQVSSNSRLSIVTSDSKSFSLLGDHCEEAQMPKFNDNSSNSHNANAGCVSVLPADPLRERKPLLTSFDIKQDEIKFEGTRRHSICLDIKAEAAEQANNAPAASSPISLGSIPADDSPNPVRPLVDHSELDAVKMDSFCSTSLITSETKFMSLNDEPLDETDRNKVAAMEISTIDTEFKFEEPAIDGASPKDRSRDASSHKSRRRDHSSTSKSHKGSGSKERHGSSSSSKDGNSSRTSSSHRRDEKTPSKSSTSSHTVRLSSSSKHHSSSSSHHRHHHSSSSSNKDRSSSSKSSSSHHKRSRSSKPSDDPKSVHKNKDPTSRHDAKKQDEKPAANGDDPCNQKLIERRRSNDSNDGNNQPNPNATHPATTHAGSALAPTTTTNTDCNSNGSSSTIGSSACDQASTLPTFAFGRSSIEDDDEFVLPQLPVVVDDQILNGCQEINLEMLIRQDTSDPVLSSIQQTLSGLDGTGARPKKPKVASNIFEARKLIKVRKQMEREEKKRMELALVLAKKYISKNSALASSLGMSVDQGVELEFACVTSSASPAPSISSPNKTAKQQPQIKERRAAPPTSGTDDEDFAGFEVDSAAQNRALAYGQHTQHVFSECAEILRTHSDYSRSIYLYNADKTMANAFADMVVGDVWQYTKNAKRQAVVLRPLAANHSLSPSDTSVSDVNSPNKPNRKRSSESSTSTLDNNNSCSSSSTSRRSAHIKYAATIQMTTVNAGADEDTFDDEEDDDDMRSMASDGYAKCVPNDAAKVTAGGSMHISPTPSDQSFSSKENSFVPKIKKAVSRSIAHNTTINSNLSCVVVAPLGCDDKPTTANHQQAQPQLLTASSNSKANSGSSAAGATTPSANKAASQRYSSDDLYKPRPILLGSRSRRRGFDASEM